MRDGGGRKDSLAVAAQEEESASGVTEQSGGASGRNWEAAPPGLRPTCTFCSTDIHLRRFEDLDVAYVQHIVAQIMALIRNGL